MITEIKGKITEIKKMITVIVLLNHRNHFLIAVISSLIAVITSSQEGSL
jgi:hypothetical protein